MGLAFKGPLTASEARFSNMVYLARETGWTLDYIEAMDFRQFDQVLATIEAQDKAKTHLQRRHTKGGHKGGTEVT